jgi:hypothetical protein
MQGECQDRKWAVTPPSPSVTVTQIAKEISPDGTQNTPTVNIGGADLGSMFDWNGKTWMVFGDAVSSFEQNPIMGLRSQVLAFSTDTIFSDGMTFNGWIVDGSGNAKQLFTPTTPGHTAIAESGIAVGNAAYIFYHDNTWNPFLITQASVQKSNDNGQTWNRIPNLTWTTNFTRVISYKHGGFVYFFGATVDPNDGIKLMRVLESQIEIKSQYEYFTSVKGPSWIKDQESMANKIVSVAGSPPTVAWNEFLQKYIMMYLHYGPQFREVHLRVANNLWGPWSTPIVITSGSQFPLLYGPYTKDDLIENGGKIVYFRMSRHDPVTFIPYSTYWMKMEFNAASPPSPAANPGFPRSN